MGRTQEKKPFTWKKGLIIFLIVLAVLVLIGLLFPGGKTTKTTKNSVSVYTNETMDLKSDYVGVLPIEGTISDSESSSLFSDGSSYHHQWLMNRVSDMMKDTNNKGILLYINTPGGSVYATDELYTALKEYQDQTGRPIYTYMASEAASGGYYIAMSSDKIYANRNCWTGSIGVILGTIYDYTGLMEDLGVEAITIHAGKDKAMGSSTEKLTKKQKKILQSLVDEAYDQFVGIVAEGRNMSEKTVKKYATGRVFTAKQALKRGLIDEIGTLDGTKEAMRSNENIGDATFVSINYSDDSNVVDRLFASTLSELMKNSTSQKETTKLEQLQMLMEENQTFTVAYLAEIHK